MIFTRFRLQMNSFTSFTNLTALNQLGGQFGGGGETRRRFDRSDSVDRSMNNEYDRMNATPLLRNDDHQMNVIHNENPQFIEDEIDF